MRRGYAMRKLERKHRRPAELLLVPMIDIFTVLVTFLLMTAVFSRTVIMELKLPTLSSDARPTCRPGWCWRWCCARAGLMVQDRAAGPLRGGAFPRAEAGKPYDLAALSDLPAADQGAVPGQDRGHAAAGTGSALRRPGAGDGHRAHRRTAAGQPAGAGGAVPRCLAGRRGDCPPGVPSHDVQPRAPHGDAPLSATAHRAS